MSGREWTEYDSCGAGYQPAEPYGDFTVALDGSNDPVVTNVTRYIGGGAAAGSVGGSGTVAQQTVSGGATTYKHGDLMGSAQLATDGSGAADSSPATLAYTAFGEHVAAGSGSAAKVGFPVTTGSIGATRYHYAGAYGYESGLLSLSGANSTLAPITLQHVGARWYQPGIGRFVQRDPCGLEGGLITYLYSGASPLSAADPTGLWTITLGLGVTGWLGFFGGDLDIEVTIGGSFAHGLSLSYAINAGGRIGAGIAVSAGLGVCFFPTLPSAKDAVGPTWGPVVGYGFAEAGIAATSDRELGMHVGGQISGGPGVSIGAGLKATGPIIGGGIEMW